MGGPLQYALSSKGVQVVGQSGNVAEIRAFAQQMLALADALERFKFLDGKDEG